MFCCFLSSTLLQANINMQKRMHITNELNNIGYNIVQICNETGLKQALPVLFGIMTIHPNPYERNNFRKYKCLRPTLLGDYEPEEIVDFKLHCGTEVFNIKWRGWDHNQNTWGTVEEFDNYPEVLEHYLRKKAEENHDSMCKLRKEISDDNYLLAEDNLVERIPDVEGIDLKDLTQRLTIKFLAIMNLNLSERRHEKRLIEEAQDLLQMCVTRQIILRLGEFRKQFDSDKEFLAYFRLSSNLDYFYGF